MAAAPTMAMGGVGGSDMLGLMAQPQSNGSSGMGGGLGTGAGGGLDILGTATEPQQSIKTESVDGITGGNDGSGDILGLFGSPAKGTPPLVAYDNNGLRVDFNFDCAGNGATTINLVFANTGGAHIDKLVFQAAVPKFLKLEFSPLSSDSIAAGSTATQTIRMTNSQFGKKKPAMKLKVSVTAMGETKTDMVTVTDFPSNC